MIKAKSEFIKWGKIALRTELQGLLALDPYIGEEFARAVTAILAVKGRVVVLGVGKSGHIGRKIASTFSSTGTPALYVHPSEASHGDLGMIQTVDIVVAISKSGESQELMDTLAYCRRFAISVIAITERTESTLANAADYLLAIPEAQEACPLGLAPTTSTIMSLAVGDALAVACLKARDFKPEQFKEYHPGGKLGQKLIRVKDVMHTADSVPLVKSDTSIKDALEEISRGLLGCVGIVNGSGNLVGIFTDGDLRRQYKNISIDHPIATVMSTLPQQVNPEALIADVMYLFTEKRIPSVFICEDERPVGIIHVHDLLRRGFI
jgi:arabinose-5-phosphate isomerase